MLLGSLKSRSAAGLTTLAIIATAVLTAAPAAADHHRPGARSLATVLAADGAGFDRDFRDFDILDNAVAAVLDAKPNSDVAVLAKGRTRLTAFLPNDAAFRRLVTDLTGTRYPREQKVFTELAGLAGIDTIENVLLYHVVPGATITYRQARASDGARLDTALDGASIRVRVRPNGRVYLVDADTNDANARVILRNRNINQGNRQIAHGISQVLRPIDL